MEESYKNAGEFENNKQKSRFEYRLNSHLAYIEYISQLQTRILINTHIPTELHSQRKIGESFVKKIVEYAQAHSISLSSKCPYVNGLLRNIAI